MSIPRAAVRHPVTSTMLFCAMLLLGIISLSRIGLELFPDVNLPSAVVITPAPGVSPFDVEEQITRPLEDSLSTIAGVQELQSTSEEGVSQVVVAFESGTDLDTVVPDVRERVNDVTGDFPSGTEDSAIFRFSAGMVPTLQIVALTETEGIDIRRLVEDEIQPEIERVAGVSQVRLFGGREPAVMVRVDLDAIAALGIPLSQVADAFEADNITMPAGSIGLEDQQLILRADAEFRNIDDIGDMLIGSAGQVPISLRHVADIELDYRPQREFMRTADGEGVRIAVFKQPGANTVDVNEEVLERIDRLKGTVLPPSVRMEVQEDQADTVRDAIGGVGEAAVQGGLLAVLVLLFFLRNMRSTFIVTTVIPVSVIATFSLIDFAGMSLNLTSLAGVTLAIGMFVDNAIVVLEAIYRKALAGCPPDEAAIVGTEEVGKAITASTLTSMSVFLPMLFVEGIAGIMFEDLSLTITFSLGVSLLSALIIIPVLSAKFMKVRPVARGAAGDGTGQAGQSAAPAGAPAADGASGSQGAPASDSAPDSNGAPNSTGAPASDGAPASTGAPASDGGEYTELSLADVDVTTSYPWLNRVLERIQRFLSALDTVYEAGIRWSLDHWKTVVASALLLFGLSLGSILLLGMEFLPEADEGRFRIDFETRAGATYAQTTEKAVEVEEIIRDIVDGEDIVSLASRIGDGGSNLASVFVSLVDLDDRDASIWDIINEADRRISREVLDIDHRISVEGMSQLAAESSGTTSPLVVRMTGDDLSAMNEFGGRIEEAMRDVRGTRSIHSSYSEARPELQFTVRRREAAGLGLSPAQIASTLRTAYDGATVGRFSDNGEDYDIDVLLSDRDRLDRSRFEQMFFVNEGGNRIPLESVVTIEEGLGPLTIERIDRRRIVEIRGGLTGDRALNRVMDDVREAVAGLGEPPEGIEIEFTGASEEMADGFESLFFALLLAVGLVYMVMASQFENLVNPLIVMFSVPFAIIGLVGILLATGTTFSILTFVGSILLVGIVVNNAIVLIDYIVQLRGRGVGLRTAIVEGGKTRLKPILMTTFTTLVGLLPMATGTGTGSEIMQPLGLSVVGGLTTSALITVILIPVLYWVVETRIRKSVQIDGSPWPPEDSSRPAPAGGYNGHPTDLGDRFDDIYPYYGSAGAYPDSAGDLEPQHRRKP